MTHPPSILLVDDQAEMLQLLITLLCPSYEVRATTCAYEAQRIITLQAPDLVLLDIVMPEVDGFAVLQWIRSSDVHIPVIMLTSLDDEVAKQRAFENGADDFITKPFQPMDVLARIKQQILISRQMRELERRNAELERINGQLREAQMCRDEFIRIASHDLRLPLSVITSSAEIIRFLYAEGRPPETDKLLSRMVSISSAAELMRCMINDFLEFRIIKDGQIQIQPEFCSLTRVAYDVMAARMILAEKKSIVIELASTSEGMAWFDRNRIMQVVDNLVSNAIKFSPSEKRIRIVVEEQSDSVHLAVFDQGPGLMQEDFSKLFKEYARLSAQPTAGEKSLGLGLSICRLLIELHNGKIGADNVLDGGARFWIKLSKSMHTVNSSNFQSNQKTNNNEVS
ncbi:MAG: hypothetical protein RL095_4119 [Verrucomicrobiota bacterium]|jgi:signal transduction histidine kinase